MTKIVMICSIYYLSMPASAQDLTATQFFTTTAPFTDNNLNIIGTYQAPEITPVRFSNFGAYDTLNLNISQTLFQRGDRGFLLIGNGSQKNKTLNVNIMQNYSGGAVFNLAKVTFGVGNIHNTVVGSKFGLDASNISGNNFRAFDISNTTFSYTSNSFGSWPVQASLSFGSDVVTKGIKGNGKFVNLDLFTSGSNAVGAVFLNHKGGINPANTNQNYYANNIAGSNSWAGLTPTDVYRTGGKALSDNKFPNFMESGLGNLLQISGDILINAKTGISGATGNGSPNGENVRLYANFVNTNTDISHYYGDMSGNGKMFINFI